MSIDIEYAIKKDVRNNPIVREVNREQKREFARKVLLGALIFGMVLFSAWQHFQILQHGYEIQRLLTDRASEETLNRRLRLEVESLRAPQMIETRALRDLHMVVPSPADTLVIERVTSATASKAVVAQVR